MDIKITIDDTLIDELCTYHKYQEQVEVEGEMKDNPESKEEFLQKLGEEYFSNSIEAYNANIETETARVTAKAKTATDIAKITKTGVVIK